MKNILKNILLTALIFVLAALSGCSKPQPENNADEDMGSFTAEKTYSYDEKYYALQSVQKDSADVNTIKVTVYDAKTDNIAGFFYPARAQDFWGICWENDTYNIWIQSADVGVLCYSFGEGKWALDNDAEKPEYIISKY